MLLKLLKMFHADERGAVDMGGTLLMGIGIVFLAVGFIIFPIVTTATDTLLAWVSTVNVTITDESFTGFTSVVGISPILVLIGYLMAGVITMYLGVRITKGGGSTKLDLGNLIMLALSMIFIAVGFIIMPVMLEGLATVLDGGGTGINAAYVGLSPIILVTPLIVLISFVAGAVLTGFMGIKSIASGT